MPSPKRALVCVTNDFNTDQRVLRTCSTLVEQGYDVRVFGRNLGRHHPLSISGVEVNLMNMLFRSGFNFYAWFNIRLFFKLLFRRCDLIWSNDMDTILASYHASKFKRCKLVFDSHELFSEVPELMNRPRVQRFWQRLESKYIPKVKTRITVSRGVAKEYESVHDASFHIIRNLPYSRAASVARTEGKPYALYQGTLNLGRGIELMIRSLHHHQLDLVICGAGDVEAELWALVSSENLDERVQFKGVVKPSDLNGITAGAAVGMSLEEDLGLNYRFALPNKLFDYIQGRIPVIVSDLPDVKEIVKSYGVGEILNERSPEALGSLITSITEKGAFAQNLELAAQELNWEKEKNKLVALLP